MSYDLLFLPREAGPSEMELLSYFRRRPHYQVERGQAIYSNEDTGVYFLWDVGLEQVKEVELDEQPSPPSLVRFNLNYFRPHVFGLEAEPEVHAFVAAFALPLTDPQVHGMGDGPYSADGFLAGYNHGNRFGYSAILAGHGRSAAKHTLPSATIERYWRWNYDRSALQAELGECVFVPKIMFFCLNSRVLSAAVWPDAIPSALPEVDLFVIPRKSLAPRRLFRRTDDIAFAFPHQAADVLAAFPVHEAPMPYRLLSYAEPPRLIANWVRDLSANVPTVKGVPVESILNEELVNTAIGA